jgi:hypothetical protein
MIRNTLIVHCKELKFSTEFVAMPLEYDKKKIVSFVTEHIGMWTFCLRIREKVLDEK